MQLIFGVRKRYSIKFVKLYSFATNPAGITFVNSINNDTTDREEKYGGCRFATTTIRASVGEPVTVDRGRWVGA